MNIARQRRSKAPESVPDVEWRGKPPTWLPRQKLAEERIPNATITIEIFQPDELQKFANNYLKLR